MNMSVSATSNSNRTTIKIYVSKSDIDLERQNKLIKDNSTDFRAQKTFKKGCSRKQIEAIIQASNLILDDYNSYSMLYNEKIGSSLVLERLSTKLNCRLDELQLKSLNENSEMIFSLFFDRQTTLIIKTFKEQYELDEQLDLLVSLVGRFGYGKTTLIKKLLNLSDKFIFPLVDNGRTTISICIIRGILYIVKDGEKYVPHYALSPNGEIEQNLQLLKTYEFKNEITLEKSEYIYNNIIEPRLLDAYSIYTQNHNNIKKVLEKFISNDKCSLDEFFGDISEYSEDDFYSKMLNVFESVDDENSGSILSGNNELFEAFKECYDERIENAIQSIKENTQRNDISYENGIISFKLMQHQIKNLNKYYEYFSSNKKEIRGKGLRFLVKDTYAEVDMDIYRLKNEVEENSLLSNIQTEHIINSKTEEGLKFNSIVLVDTMGCGHTRSNKQESSLISTDILANASLLNESDTIILMEKATETMGDDIKGQIRAIESLGCKDKTMLCYSHYNQFIKGDMKSDEERLRMLSSKFYETLKSLYLNNPDKAERIFQTFTDEDNKQIVYLKGLVPRKVEEEDIDLDEDERDCDDSNILNSAKYNNSLADELNKGFEKSNKCLNELLKKIILVSEASKKKECLKRTIIENSTSEIFAVRYYQELYPEFLKNYLSVQEDIYLKTVPAFNTSRALCNNASKGDASFAGARKLEPFLDSFGEIILCFSVFIDNAFELKFDINEDGELLDKSLNENFLIEKIKTIFSSKIEDFFHIMLVSSKLSEWKNLESDSGSGVKFRRAQGIYNLLKTTFSMRSVSEATLAYIRESIRQMIEDYGINE